MRIAFYTIFVNYKGHLVKSILQIETISCLNELLNKCKLSNKRRIVTFFKFSH